ncbi:MAG: hypothetical protein LAP87_03550 [Acidobacteriia bacterium]|nr:hypothetical protein [Terriglobia bacterium]
MNELLKAHSPEAWVLLRPRAAWPRLAGFAAEGGRWLAWRRPLLFAFVLGCIVSLMTSGRVTLRLAGPATIYWTFVPLCEVASLAAVGARSRRKVPISRAIDLFFMGHGVWFLWLIGFAAVWAFCPAPHAFAWLSKPWVRYGPVFAAIAWSGYIDFWFFRSVFARTRAGAACALLAQRLICWSGALALFLAPSAWTVLASRLGL